MPKSELEALPNACHEANKEKLVYPLQGVEIGVVISALQTEPLPTSDAFDFSIEKFPKLKLEADYRTTPRFDLNWCADIKAASEIASRLRFSLEWCKWCPNRPDQFDQQAIDGDIQKLIYAKSLGLKVDLCLNHFASPKWIIEHDGWLENQVPWYFAHFAKKVVNELGPFLDPDTRFNIFNELATRVTMELSDKLPPSKKEYLDKPPSFNRRVVDMFSMVDKIRFAVKRCKHVIRHYNRRHDTHFSWYSASQITPIRPTDSTRKLDRAAAKLANYLQNSLPLNATVTAEDEYVAITYYRSVTVGADKWNGNHEVIDESSDGTSNDYNVGPFLVNGSNLGDQEMKSINGWPFTPEGILEVLETVHRLYPNKKIILAENGYPGQFQNKQDEHQDNLARCVHLISHLAMVSLAHQRGIPVVEADIWSLVDNYEFGRLRDRFGLLHIDYNDHLKRTPRPTYYILKEIKNNCEINLPQIYQMLRSTCDFSDADLDWINSKVKAALAKV